MNQGTTKLRVAVTGASGLIGARVVGELLARGHDVIAIDKRVPAERRCPFVCADLRSREQVFAVLDRVDSLVHLGELNGPVQGLPAEEVFLNNTQCTCNVLQMASDIGIRRVIYSSSAQVYGFAFGFGNDPLPAVPRHLPFDETHPLLGLNGYAVGKIAMEYYAQMLARTSKLSIALLRFPGVMRQGADDRCWSELATQRYVPALGIYVHLIDAAQLAVLALEKTIPGCEAYNACSVSSLIRTPMSEFLLEHHPGYPAVPSDWPDQKSVMSSEKARRDFGWSSTFEPNRR